MAQEGTDIIDATPLYSNAEELGNCLFALTQPNNDDLKKATLLIRNFLDKPESIMPLVQQIENSKHAEVRQVAAVYLREQIEMFYNKIPKDIKPKLKEFLITKLVEVNNRPERVAIGAAIASIAKFAFINESDGWNELLVALEKICKPDQNVELREVGYILWRNLVSFCGGSMKKNFGKILEILQLGLKDENSIKIQVESVKAIGSMVDFLENDQEVKIIESIIPSMVAVIDKCLKKGDEENVIAGMEVFNDLVESSVPVLHKHAQQLTAFNLKIASAKNELPMTVRKQATNFATWMCKAKPKTVIKHNFIEAFISLCINLIIESKDDDDMNKQVTANDDEKVNSFLSPLGIACDLLDEIFLNIPSEQCFGIAMKAVKQLLADSKNTKPRKAGYVLIAMMSEGCKEEISSNDNLSQLLDICLKGLKDQATPVRKCALEAISQICTHCNFDILKYHKLVLPNLFEIFQNENESTRVKERALSAIEMFVDAYDPEDDDNKSDNKSDSDFVITNYVQDIMRVIGICLETDSVELRKQAIATLSSIATASRRSFSQYLPKVLQLLESLLQDTSEEKIELRAEATSCLGSVAGAVGIEAFKANLPKFHSYVMKGLANLDYSDIREASFMYFSELSDIMGQDILSLDTFEEMLNFILFVIEDDDGLMVELPDDGFSDAIPKNLINAENALDAYEINEQETQLQNMSQEQLEKLMAEAMAAEEDDFEEANDDDDDDEDNIINAVGQLKSIKLNVTTGFMEEKAAAVHALTAFIKNGGYGFLQHMDEVWERLTYLWEYPHSLVKMSVSNCFHEFFTLIVNHSLQDNPQAMDADNGTNNKKYPYSKGIEIEYNSNIQNWIDTIFPLYIQAIRDEEDRDALVVIVDFFIEELRILGPNSISSSMEELIAAINLYLKEESQCHQSSDTRNDDTKDIATKHKWISDSIAELIACLAELWGNKFVDIFGQIFDNLLHFGRATRHPQDQAMLVGCIADCCCKLADAGIPNVMSKFSDRIFTTTLRIAQSQDVNMRQNALYCMGAMFAVCNQESNLAHSQNLLRCIKIYVQLPKDGKRNEKLVRDNALSALGKMLIAETDSLPTKELLPIFVNSLPLTCDYSENRYVYSVLIRFITEETTYIEPLIVNAMNLLGNALSDDNVIQKTTDEIVAFFRKICKNDNFQKLIQEKVDQLPQQNIFKALQN